MIAPETPSYYNVPVPYMLGGVVRYVERGIPPGSFLRALFSNDLIETFRNADEVNTVAMLAWVHFIYKDMPSATYGNPQRVEAWIERGGLLGVPPADGAT